jgi:hypothetical protein
MKKATAATVAQSIKSTKQLSQLQGLAPAKSCKPPLKSSCSALQIDADQANLHLDLLGLDETCTNIRLIPHKGRRGGAINGTLPRISTALKTSTVRATGSTSRSTSPAAPNLMT